MLWKFISHLSSINRHAFSYRLNDIYDTFGVFSWHFNLVNVTVIKFYFTRSIFMFDLNNDVRNVFTFSWGDFIDIPFHLYWQTVRIVNDKATKILFPSSSNLQRTFKTWDWRIRSPRTWCTPSAKRNNQGVWTRRLHFWRTMQITCLSTRTSRRTTQLERNFTVSIKNH